MKMSLVSSLGPGWPWWLLGGLWGLLGGLWGLLGGLLGGFKGFILASRASNSSLFGVSRWGHYLFL